MKDQLAKKIFVITTLLGMLASTAASGSDLKLTLDSSGATKFQQIQKTLKRASSPRKSPAFMPKPRTTRGIPLNTAEHTAQTVNLQNRQTVKSHAKLGWRFLLDEQPQAAVAAYREALRKNPRSAKSYLGLGISLKNLGQVRLAKKALVKAVKLNPRLPSALVHLGYLYAEGHLGQADRTTARRLFSEASQLGDPFAAIALLDMKSRSKL